METILNKMQEKLSLPKLYIKNAKRAAAVLFAVYLVALIPLLRANYDYNDDLGRKLYGYTLWEFFSRYITEYLSHFVHAGHYLADISPLPQLLAVCILVAASMILLKQVHCEQGINQISLWDVAAVLPLGLSPYYLECHSYKYDSPYMALSVLASIAPLAFRNKRPLVYCGAAFAGTLVMCMTYQASSGIFPMCVILLTFLIWNRGEKGSLVFCARSAAAYLAGIGVFALFIMKPADDYVSNKIAALSAIPENYLRFIREVRSDFKPSWLLLTALIFLGFVLCSMWSSRRSKPIALLAALLCMGLMLLCCFGLYPVLAKTMTNARSMYGFGVCTALAAIGTAKIKGGYIRLSAVALAWMFITFSCAYGNGLAAQKEYEELRISEVIIPLAESEDFGTEPKKLVQVTGTVGYAPVVENMSAGYGMMKKLIPVTFLGADYAWSTYRFYYYYGLDTVCKISNSEPDPDYLQWEVIHQSIYHTIYRNDNQYVIELYNGN